MTILLFTVMILTEAAFVVSGFTGTTEKREWNKKRLLVNVTELVAFAVMLLLPGMDLSFRFLGMAVLLLIRSLAAGLGFLIGKSSTAHKSRPGMIVSCLLSVALFAFALTPAFLFKSYESRPLTGSYTPVSCTAILTDASRTEQFEQDGSFREIPVHIFYPAEADGIADHSLPLVFFSHGAFGWYESNLSACLELASNGYVVVSMEHPYHSLFTKDTSGSLITADKTFLQEVMTISNSDYPATERYAVFETECAWIRLREADMNFAVDTLRTASETQDFAAWTFTEGEPAQFETAMRLIDTDQIGLMGHSLGGATAVTVGRRDDIAAVIDIDGTMIGEQVDFADGKYVINETPYTTPLLVIDNEESHFEVIEAVESGYVYADTVVLDHAEHAYQTYFAGAGHMNYTDLPLISPFLAKKLGTGEIDPEQCTDTLNALILDFFNCTLKGQGEFSVQESY